MEFMQQLSLIKTLANALPNLSRDLILEIFDYAVETRFINIGPTVADYKEHRDGSVSISATVTNSFGTPNVCTSLGSSGIVTVSSAGGFGGYSGYGGYGGSAFYTITR